MGPDFPYHLANAMYYATTLAEWLEACQQYRSLCPHKSWKECFRFFVPKDSDLVCEIEQHLLANRLIT